LQILKIVVQYPDLKRLKKISLLIHRQK